MRTRHPNVMYVATSESRAAEIEQQAAAARNGHRHAQSGRSLPDLWPHPGDAVLAASLNLSARDFIFLLPAPLLPRKNIEFALAAMKELRALDRNPLLLITAPALPFPAFPPPRATADFLRKTVPDEIKEHVVFVHDFFPVTDQILRDLYLLADCLFIPPPRRFPFAPCGGCGYRLPIWCQDIPAYQQLAEAESAYPLGELSELPAAMEWLECLPTFRNSASGAASSIPPFFTKAITHAPLLESMEGSRHDQTVPSPTQNLLDPLKAERFTTPAQLLPRIPMAKTVSLQVSPRSAGVGRTALKAVRQAGRVPRRSLRQRPRTRPSARGLLRSMPASSIPSCIPPPVKNVLVDVEITDASGAKLDQHLALLQDVQHHPLEDYIIHIDLHEIAQDEILHAEVPVTSVGEPDGVKNGGGLLETMLRTIRVACLPRDLPELFSVDVSHLKIGESVHVSELKLPEGVTVSNPSELPVFSVFAPKEEVAETPGAPAAMPRPEVIKEKKVEGEAAVPEAKTGGKDAKPAARLSRRNSPRPHGLIFSCRSHPIPWSWASATRVGSTCSRAITSGSWFRRLGGRGIAGLPR